MLKVNRKLEYALIALAYMHKTYPGKLTTAKEICDIHKTPFDTTSRMLQLMAQHGILHAEHGAHGGYQIVKDLTKISLLELTELLVGPISIANCFNHSYAQCDLVQCCNVIAPMLKINERIGELFRTISVLEVIESKHQQEKTIREDYAAKSQR